MQLLLRAEMRIWWGFSLYWARRQWTEGAVYRFPWTSNPPPTRSDGGAQKKCISSIPHDTYKRIVRMSNAQKHLTSHISQPYQQSPFYPVAMAKPTETTASRAEYASSSPIHCAAARCRLCVEESERTVHN